jgi:hypothetical protein
LLSTDKEERKGTPVATGVLDYFPLALMAVAHCSKVGNDQHNPGQPLHWAKEKSTDHADCIVRHLMERGTLDTDGVRHSAKVAWRALALLQTEIERDFSRPDIPSKTFVRDDIVRKRSGSEWQGKIVGEYSTALTPEGYAVESDAHAGSVQIYPVGALEPFNKR